MNYYANFELKRMLLVINVVLVLSYLSYLSYEFFFNLCRICFNFFDAKIFMNIKKVKKDVFLKVFYHKIIFYY